MKKSVYLSLFSILLVCLLSCSFSCFNKPNVGNKKGSQEPVVTAKRVWELDVEKYSDDPVVYGNYGYMVQGNKFQESGRYFYLTKINLENGQIEWKSEKFLCDEGSGVEPVNGRPAKCGEYVFVFSPASGDDDFAMLYVFDEKTGSLLQKISNLNIKGYCTLIPYKDKYLFWQSWVWENGISSVQTDYSVIHRFDVSKLEEDVFVSHVEGNILSDLCVDESEENGLLYFETMGGYDFDYGGGYPYPKINPVVGAVDCESGETVWTYKIENSCWPGIRESLLIQGNKLFVMDYGLVCLDKRNGKSIFENLMETIDFDAGYKGGVFRGEAPYMSFYENKIYCTNGSSWSGNSYRDKYYLNIQCLNAKNGDLVWGDLPVESCSLGGRPYVIDDKLFVVTYYQGLRVYNPKNGKLIGVDPTILNGGQGKNPVYKDMFLTVLTSDTEWSHAKLVALKGLE